MITSRRSQLLSAAAALAFIVVAVIAGYRSIGLPPVVIVGGSGIIGFVMWVKTYLRQPVGPEIILAPRQTLAGTVRELDDGWFRILTWSLPGGGTGVWAGMATYQEDRSRVERFKEQAEAALRELFPT